MQEGFLAIPAPSITGQQHCAFADALHLVAERYALALFWEEVWRSPRIRVH